MRLSILLVLTLVATSVSSASSAVAAPKKLAREAKGLSQGRVIRRGSMQSMRRRKVDLGTGRSVTLGQLTKRAFDEQRSLGRQLKRARGVRGGVKVQEQVVERKKAFEITLRTQTVVTDPSAVVRSAPEFRRYRPQTTRRLSQLAPKRRRAVERWAKGDLKKLPSDDPLRRAFAASGLDGLVDAMAEGKGTFTLEQTLVVPKAAPPMKLTSKALRRAPRVKKRRRRVRGRRSLDPQAERFRELLGLDDEVDPSRVGMGPEPLPEAGLPLLGQVSQSGVAGGSLKMLTGFTKNDEWTFSEKYGYSYGYFYGRVTAWAGIGLRMPVRFKHRVNPSRTTFTGRSDVSSDFRVKLEAEPFDGRSSFYRDVGLSSSKVFGGKELVMEAGVEARVIVKAFGKKLLDETWSREYDYGRHFTPPFGNRKVKLTEFFIPASITRTSFNYGPASGSFQIGARLEARGKIGASLRLRDHRGNIDSRRIGRSGKRSTHAVWLDDEDDDARFEGTLRRCSRSCRGDYGFRLYAPKYRTTLSLVPAVRIKARADLWIHTFSYDDDFWLPSFAIDLTSVTFGGHAGTDTNELVLKGEKIFTQSGSTGL